MIALSYIKESPTMRLTSRKKEILSYFEPDNREWVTGEIGAPPLDVSSAEYLLYGTGINDNRHWLESTRRMLEAMVKDGLLKGTGAGKQGVSFWAARRRIQLSAIAFRVPTLGGTSYRKL